MDITYIKLPVGFAYLGADFTAAGSWAGACPTRCRTFCLEALEDALAQGVAIVNSDQGAQFTAKDWVSALEDWHSHGRQLRTTSSRFWRSIKYEEVYLRVESLPEARRCIGAYIDFYNSQRPHQSLDYNTPDEVYFEGGHRPVDMMDKPDGLPTSPQGTTAIRRQKLS